MSSIVQPLKAVLKIEFTTGVPEVVTVKLPAVPWAKPALLALVIDGGPPTVRVNAWVVVAPLDALRQNV